MTAWLISAKTQLVVRKVAANSQESLPHCRLVVSLLPMPTAAHSREGWLVVGLELDER